MNAPDYHNARAVVVGLGKSGLSAVRYLHARGAQVAATDTRAEPPGLAELRRTLPAVRTSLGRLDESLLNDAEFVVLSPGLAASGGFFERARQRGLPLLGDVELFARAAVAPIAGITGTNGKSTVTTLIGAMARRAGREVRIGGNLGQPALELLDERADLYVLELSSYQLESTDSLHLRAAVLLNVTPDHLDRYASTDDYAQAKARIFRHCEVAVVNVDDERVRRLVPVGVRQLRFSLDAASAAEYRFGAIGGRAALLREARELLPVAAMKLQGRHNVANALAALAAGEALGLPEPAMIEELRSFTGLAHRTQWVAERRGVRYIDDSKGTNVGATLAAVAGLDGPLLIIAGGEGKGQDFTPLCAAFKGKVRCCLLIGRDAGLLAEALAGVCELEHCATLEAAVARAAARAAAGDCVLLSPACASLDMFRDYAERGERFAAAVHGLAA